MNFELFLSLITGELRKFLGISLNREFCYYNIHYTVVKRSILIIIRLKYFTLTAFNTIQSIERFCLLYTIAKALALISINWSRVVLLIECLTQKL
jgi:hypothetical protein